MPTCLKLWPLVTNTLTFVVRAGSAAGRPMRLPLALALAMPERTRSRISSRSNSAMLAKMPKTKRPFGVANVGSASFQSAKIVRFGPVARQVVTLGRASAPRRTTIPADYS